MNRVPIAENAVHTIVFCSDDERSEDQLHAVLESSECEVRRVCDETQASEAPPGAAADIVFIDSGLISAGTAQMVANIKRSRPHTWVVLSSENGRVPVMGREFVDVVIDSAEFAQKGRQLLDELRNTCVPLFCTVARGEAPDAKATSQISGGTTKNS